MLHYKNTQDDLGKEIYSSFQTDLQNNFSPSLFNEAKSTKEVIWHTCATYGLQAMDCFFDP